MTSVEQGLCFAYSQFYLLIKATIAAISVVLMLNADRIHGMQWCFKTFTGKCNAKTQHKCGAIQIIRHKMVESYGAKSTAVVCADLSIPEGL